MTKLEKITQAITRIAGEYLNDLGEKISAKDPLQSVVGVDSTGLLEIVLDVEEEYDIELTGRVSSDPTIAELSHYVFVELKQAILDKN